MTDNPQPLAEIHNSSLAPRRWLESSTLSVRAATMWARPDWTRGDLVRLSVVETNEVHLIGRLSAPPMPKTLPGEEAAITFRLSVSRAPELIRRQKSDSIDCISSRAATIKSAVGWVPGDVLELKGALHHRFWREGAATRNVYEVEVRTVRRLAHSPATAPRQAGERADKPSRRGAGATVSANAVR